MESSSSASRTGGFLASFKALGSSLLASVHDRLELFSLELHEEKFRLIQIFIWISAAIFSGMMAVAFGSVTLVYLFPEEARLKALAGLTGLYVLAVLVIAVAFRRYLARQPSPFSATLSELKEDIRVSSNGTE